MVTSKWKVLASAMALGVGMSNAAAQVDILVVVEKDRDKEVVETIDKQKRIVIVALVADRLEGSTAFSLQVERAAHAEAIVNQLNGFPFDAEGTLVFSNRVVSLGATRTLEVSGSGNDSEGILVVNQAAGNLNNQAGAISVSYSAEDAGPGYADAQAAADQLNLGNLGREGQGEGEDGEPVPLTRSLTVSGSFDGGQGVVSVNQSVGDFNNQVNAAALAVVPEGGVALSEAELGQASFANWVIVDPIHRLRWPGTFSGNRGIITANAAAGVGSNQGNVVSMSWAGARDR